MKYKLTLITLSLVLAVLSGFAAKPHHPSKESNSKTARKETLQQIALSQQYAVVKEKKYRSNSRLKYHTYLSPLGSNLLVHDSMIYKYTGNYGYDATPEEFPMIDLTAEFKNDYRNFFDTLIGYLDDGSSNLVLSDSAYALFNSDHQLTYYKYASDINAYTLISAQTFDASGRKIYRADSILVAQTIYNDQNYVYNTDNKIIYLTFNSGGNPVEHDSLFYNADGKLYLVHQYNPGMNLTGKFDIVYDAQGNLTEWISSSWQGTSWEFVDKSVHAYDGTNRLTTTTELIYDNGNWLNDSRDSLQYSSGSNPYPTVYLSQVWDTTALNWSNNNKYEYTYNNSNQILTARYYFWNMGQYGITDGYNYVYETFTPASIQDLNTVNDLTIYPNPTENVLTVKLPQINQSNVISYSVADAAGKVCATGVKFNTGNGTFALDVHHLPSGWYQLMVTSGKDQYATRWIKK